MPLPRLASGLLLKFPCAVCGFLIISRSEAPKLFANMEQHGVSCHAPSEWLSDFRAFHPREPFLTGIGRNLAPGDAIGGGNTPLDPAKSCDDDDYQHDDKVAFKVRRFPFHGLEPSNVGYPLHNSCWQLLHRHAQLRGVEDLTDARYTNFIFQLHNSTLDGSSRAWADDYGGLLDSAGEMRIPAAYDASFNPFDIKEITVIIKEMQDKNVLRIQETPIFGQRRKYPDLECFTGTRESNPSLHTLPLEIVLMTIEHLSTADLLNFWIASANVPDYFPQRFWRSRFERGMEFGHLFEFTDLWHNPDVHWYTLYWKVKNLLSSDTTSPALRNRRRIRLVVDNLTELTLKYNDQPVEGDREKSLNPILLETDGFSAHQMRLTLPPPDQIKTLNVSTVELGSRRYISGLRFNNNPCGLGYYHSSSSKTFCVDESVDGPIQEIVCYMDHMGVQGLSVVTERGWKTGITPDTRTIGQLSQGVLPLGKHLIAHLDATKVTALGIDSPLTAPRDSRNYLLWRGDLPPENVTVDLARHLYHKIHRHQDIPWNFRYNPVQYHLFSSRESLVGITGYVGYLARNLLGLEFSYQQSRASNDGPRTISVGKIQGTPMHFPVDGPGGEYITGFKMTTMSGGVLAPVVSLITNRNRSTWFCIKKSLVDVPQKYVHESYYTQGPDEYVAGLMWASGGFGDQIYPFWNLGILCKPYSASYS